VFGGWAWAEATVRAGGFIAYKRANTIYAIRAERALESTNDFGPALADDPGFGALLGSVDDYDYVDRRTAMLAITRVFGSIDRGLATLQFGVASDRGEQTRVARGLFASGAAFRPNRGVIDGTSLLSMADIELHPNVTGEFVQPGIGARLHVESGRGDLEWTRVELKLASRSYLGPVSFITEAHGGFVLGDMTPPQRLFELGGFETLPGYEYKQFAGDRAALFRTFASYRFNMWQRPRRFWGSYQLPGFSPGIAASAQGGWTELSSPGARAAARLLSEGTSLAAPEATHGTRATVGVGLTFFSDILHIGLARPVDRAARLRLVAGFGTVF
jgi:hypothetical protein